MSHFHGKKPSGLPAAQAFVMILRNRLRSFHGYRSVQVLYMIIAIRP